MCVDCVHHRMARFCACVIFGLFFCGKLSQMQTGVNMTFFESWWENSWFFLNANTAVMARFTGEASLSRILVRLKKIAAFGNMR